MRVTTRFLPACLVALSALGWCRGALSHRAGGQESGKPQSLFNGKDLTGWVTPDDKAIFSVENREIVSRTQGDLKKNEFLATEKPYRDMVSQSRAACSTKLVLGSCLAPLRTSWKTMKGTTTGTSGPGIRTQVEQRDASKVDPRRRVNDAH